MMTIFAYSKRTFADVTKFPTLIPLLMGYILKVIEHKHSTEKYPVNDVV